MEKKQFAAFRVTKNVSVGTCIFMHFLMAFFILFPARADVFPKPIFCEKSEQRKCIPRFNCSNIKPVQDCAERELRLSAYRDNERDHLGSISEFLQSVQDYLSNAEGQLPPSEGAAAMEEVLNQANQNHACLQKELDEILKAAQNCKSSQH